MYTQCIMYNVRMICSMYEIDPTHIFIYDISFEVGLARMTTFSEIHSFLADPTHAISEIP